jgi:hypothetical protein
MHSLPVEAPMLSHHGGMRTRVGGFALDYCRPGLLAALLKIAVIGTWRGRTFLDDDADLADVADFVPAETMPMPAASPSAAPAGGSHPVAA